jgi:hypothetical protein
VDLSRKLVAYTAGAAAAGLASAEPADAAIIARQGAPITSGSTINIDFDASGTDEYRIAHRLAEGADATRLLLKDSTAETITNSYVRTTPNIPTALAAGTEIGPGSTVGSEYDGTLANLGTGAGQWSVDNVLGNTQFVGVQFRLAAGEPLYNGWIGVDITNASDLTGVVTGYAYEDSGGPIAAGAVPEPSGLALLALGAPFLARRRRT